MQIIKAVPGVPFSIGRQGENQARQVQIDLTPWVGLYGPGNAELIYQRPGESTSYPVAIERNGNLVLWTVTNTDTALASAPQDRVYGRAELRYYVDDTLVKSEISAVSVYASMEIPSEVPEPPGQNWLDQALAAGAQAKEAATKAEAAIEKAPLIGENGNWFIWNAVSGTYEDTGRFSGGGAGSNVAIDPTLTQSGQAADAKAVGDAISALSGENVSRGHYLLKSPNGTIFKLTVTDGGALQVVGTVEDEDGVLDDLVPGRLLAWHDEFETLDTTIWGYEEGHVRAAHVVYFEAAEKNVFVKDSCVHFKALRDNPTEDYEWSAGGLGTDINIGNGFTFVNGLLEFKVKIPVIGAGRWATIWCLGAINKKTTVDGTTATRGLKSSMCGEIDIMDYVGGSFPLVYYDQDIYSDMFDTYKYGNETLTQNEWHILGIEKSTNELIFYVDREEKGRLDLTGIESFNDKAFNIKMNCVVGGASGTIADDMTEMEMIVDWVRYYLPQSESEIATELTASIGMTEFALNKGMNRAIYPQFNPNAANAFVEWYSSDQSVATAYGGYIKALKNGATTITGKDNDGNILFEAQLTVSDDAYNPVGRIVVTDIPEMLQYNMPVKLSYLCYPEYATSKVAVASCPDSAVTCDGDTITLTESLTVDRTATITLSNAEGNVSTSFEVTLHKNASLDLSDTTGLLAEYNQTGLTYTDDVKNVDWADNKGNCNTIKLRSGGSTKLQEWTVNGLLANHANVYSTSERFIQTDELDAFTMLVYADITATNSIFGVNGNTVASSNAKVGGVAVTNVDNLRFAVAVIEDYSVDKLALLSVYIMRRNTDGYQVGYYNGTEVVWSATANPAASENVNTNTALGSAKAGGQLAQGLYKHIALYNIAKTDEEVTAICEELYGMYKS